MLCLIIYEQGSLMNKDTCEGLLLCSPDTHSYTHFQRHTHTHTHTHTHKHTMLCDLVCLTRPAHHPYLPALLCAEMQVTAGSCWYY